MQGCSGSSLHWAYKHGDVYCVITVRHHNIEALFVWTPELLLFWKTAADMSFKVFEEATIYEPRIMLIPFAWWHHQKLFFLCLNAKCLFLFDKLLLTWISRFLQNHVDAESSEYGYFSFFEWWLFHKLLLKWNSKIFWKQPYMTHNEVRAYCIMTSPK